jgi:RNA polymerase sigma-70 factor (ECF subfamily)
MVTPSPARRLFHDELPRLYAFLHYMWGDRGEAHDALRTFVAELRAGRWPALLAAAHPGEALLGLLARTTEERLGRKSEGSFEELDRILRSDITRPIDLHRVATSEDTKLVHRMLWQLKRQCLVRTLGCLPPGVRIAFVLTDLMGFSPATAAELLEIKESAFRVRLTRARKRLEDYLAPRCVHVDRQNPCSCSGRLMIALDARFIDPAERTQDVPHAPHDADGPQRDVGNLYRGLPQARLEDEAIRRLVDGVP